MINTAIFDIGGTLIGAPDLFEALAALFPERNVYNQIKHTFFDEYIAVRDEKKEFLLMKKIVENVVSIVSAELNCLDQSKYAEEVYYDTFVTRSYLFDDTRLLLEYLKNNNVRLLAASDADADFLYDEFDRHHLNKYFDRVFISSELKAYKPQDNFVKALKREIHESLDKTMFVGNMEPDVLTGQKLGVKTVFRRGYECVASPDYIIDCLKDLVEIVNEL